LTRKNRQDKVVTGKKLETTNMTMPHGEYNSKNSARIFLYDLTDPKKSPRVPKKIRLEARRILSTFQQFFPQNKKYEKYLKKWGIKPNSFESI
jgi:hypothetical protein